MQPYRDGKPFGELEQVSMEDITKKIQAMFGNGADEVRVYENYENAKVIGHMVTDKEERVEIFNNRAGRRALKFKNKNRRNHV